MTVTVVGDFTDPLSYLASQRVEQLTSLGICDVRWLAVQADRRHPIGGRPLGEAAAREASLLSLPGEHVPSADASVPNGRAATSAYAESLTDGQAPAMRRALFDAIWVEGRKVDDPDVVRSVVFAVLHPHLVVDVETQIAARRLLVPLGDARPVAGTRRLGLIVSMAGGPLTVTGQDRVDEWRRLWLHRGAPRLPFVLTDIGEAVSGDHALRWLATRLPHGGAPVAADTAAATTPATGEALAAV